MTRFEYKVVPAPKQGEKARGVRGAEDRFALALTNLLNAYGRDGWDYVRTDTLPVEERHGLTGRTSTTYQNMLVFRRALSEPAAPHDEAGFVGAAPQPQRPAPEPLSASAASQLASVRPAVEPPPQPRGPRLVASPFLERSPAAPALGPAAGGSSGAAVSPLTRQMPTLTRRGDDGAPPPRE